MQFPKVIFFVSLLGSVFSYGQTRNVNAHLFAPGEALAEVTNKTLGEISGIAASETHRGMFWVHNDSGNEPKVFLINEKLEIVLTCILKDIHNRDWEDIAIGPGPKPGKTYVYVGEIGDNFAMFPYKVIYRFEEPESIGTPEQLITEVDTFVFALEDGAKDTETLLVNPTTGNIYTVTKREDPVHLYKIGLPVAGDTVIAKKLLSIPATRIVGGDFSADGSELLMKTYDQVLYWKIEGDISTALKMPPRFLPYQKEPQGEAITFARDRSGYYTISELNRGKRSFLFFYRAAPSQE